MNKISKKYINAVKMHLKCTSKCKKKFLDTLKTELYNFELSNPGAKYTDYIKEFDTPKSTAKEYSKELSRKEKRSYWYPRIGILLAIIVAVFVFLIVAVHNLNEKLPGYFVESPVIELSESEAICN